MSYGDGQWWATFNGEIYNFIELRADLEGRGHRFRSRSDCEVLLAAFAEWGADCQLRFNGMWAFAIWDTRAKTLFISRDRFGVKPLFYVQEPQRFAFASELKAFLSLAEFDLSFDPQAVANKLHDMPMMEAAEASLLRGVRKLAAGHCLIQRRGEAPLIRRWWKTLDHLRPVPERYEEQVEEFRSVFFDACRLRTRSDRPLGTTLSGGLDSSSILCALSRLRSDGAPDSVPERPIHSTVHAQFPESATNESDYAVAAARQANAILHFMPLEATQVLWLVARHLALGRSLLDGAWRRGAKPVPRLARRLPVLLAARNEQAWSRRDQTDSPLGNGRHFARRHREPNQQDPFRAPRG